MEDRKFIGKLVIIILIGAILIAITHFLSSIYAEWGVVIGGAALILLIISMMVVFREKSK
jgi:hypothetical protein